MCVNKYYIVLIFLLLGGWIVRAQESRTEIYVDFRANRSAIDPLYSDNAARMQEIVSFLRNIRRDSTINITEVSFCGAASPEGSDQLNRRLARGRLTSLEKFVRKKVDIPDSIITRDDSHIPWGYLKAQIEKSDLQRKKEVIAILEEEARLVDYHHPNTHIDNRVVKLKRLDGGKVWRQINSRFFKRMRNACVIFVTYKKETPKMQPEAPATTTVAPKPVVEEKVTPDTTAVVQPVVPQEEEWCRKLYLKTNALGWALAITNIAAEIDLAQHWSFAIPIYYSGYNYFTSTIKFRTFALQPEIRFWPKKDNQGFFVGAHFGMAQYNVTVNGEKRYQDHKGETPALGGGLSVGYRMPISKNKKWHLEFAVGAGVYELHYDTFYNVDDGKLIDTHRHTYWGVDNAAVNISYRFDLKKSKR